MDALAAAENLTEYGRFEALRLIAEHWGAEDLQAALAWALAFEDSSEREGTMLGVLGELLGGRPVGEAGRPGYFFCGD